MPIDRMKRREFISLIASAATAWPLVGRAQQPERKLPRIGLILNVPSENSQALTKGLREAGYIDGQSAVMETRVHSATFERIDEFASELVALKCSVIFASDPYSIRAVTRATSTIPIVGIDLEDDPVASGWAQSLARPSANLTGLFLDIPKLAGKLIELLRETVPTVSHAAALWDATIGAVQFRAMEPAAWTAGITLESLPIGRVGDIKGAFERAARERIDGLIVLSSPLMFNQRSQIASMASSTGTSVPWMWALLRLPRLRGASHADDNDNRFRHR